MRRRDFLGAGGASIAATCTTGSTSEGARHHLTEIETIAYTACCLWEWTLENQGLPRMQRYFDNHGSCAMRLAMTPLSREVEEAWELLSEEEKDTTIFDWQFVPQWCEENFFDVIRAVLT